MSALAPKLDPDTDIDCIHHPKAPLRLHFNPAPPSALLQALVPRVRFGGSWTPSMMCPPVYTLCVCFFHLVF